MQPNMNRRRFLTLAGVGALSPALLKASQGLRLSDLAFSAKSAAGPTAHLTVYWWGSSSRDLITNHVFDVVKTLYPHITFSGEFAAFGDYFDKLNTLIAGGTMPDIVQLNAATLAQYAKEGLLLDLSKIMPEMHLGKYYDTSALTTGEVYGGLYGINFGYQYVSCYYNAKLVKQAGLAVPKNGANWQDWASFASSLHQKLGSSVAGMTDNSENSNVFLAYLDGLGHQMFTKSGKLGFSRSDALQWFEYWAKLRDTGVVGSGAENHAYVAEGLDADDPITKGESVITMQPIVLFTGYQAVNRDPLKLAAVPRGPVGWGLVNPFFGWAVSAHTKSPAAVADFLHVWYTNPAAIKALGLDRAIPPSNAQLPYIEKVATPAEKTEIAFLDTYRPQVVSENVSPPIGEALVLALDNAGEDISLGGKSVASATDSFIEAVQSALAHPTS